MKTVENKFVGIRFVFLAVAGVGLVAGLVAALGLLGVISVPAQLASDHGPLMVFGFVGGAIGLERAVAVRTDWAWAGPAFHVLGAITLLAGTPRLAPALFFALSFVVLGAVYVTIHLRQATLAIIVQAAGVIGGVCAAVLWGTGASFREVMPLAVLYVVATIIGERIELARITIEGTPEESGITALVLVLAASAVVYMAAPSVGFAFMGAILAVIAGLTARVDVARRLVRSRGLPRYSAACMLFGYGWLALAGIVWLSFGHGVSGYAYDVAVHAVFLGFVISMIFAHAPIIVTSVLRISLPYHAVLYVPMVLLHLSLAVRFVSDARSLAPGWQAGGVLGVVAVATFMVAALYLGVTGTRARNRKRDSRLKENKGSKEPTESGKGRKGAA